MNVACTSYATSRPDTSIWGILEITMRFQTPRISLSIEHRLMDSS